MQELPAAYTPQSGYPTQGPYALTGQPLPPAQQQQQQPLLPPQEEQNVPFPQQEPLQISSIQPVMPPPQANTMLSYQPPQQPQQNFQNWFPQYPHMMAVPLIGEAPSSDENENDSECHEIIGITMGGKPCPPRQDPVVCCDCKMHKPTKVRKYKRSKPKEKPKEGESPCAHTFCIVERAKIKPVGLPWASGLYKYQPAPEEPPKIKVIRKKYKCKCRRKDDEEVEDEEDSDSEETVSTKSSTSNSSAKQMMDFMETFCSLLEMAKKCGEKKKKRSKSSSSSLSVCYDG